MIDGLNISSRILTRFVFAMRAVSFVSAYTDYIEPFIHYELNLYYVSDICNSTFCINIFF